MEEELLTSNIIFPVHLALRGITVVNVTKIRRESPLCSLYHKIIPDVITEMIAMGGAALSLHLIGEISGN